MQKHAICHSSSSAILTKDHEVPCSNPKNRGFIFFDKKYLKRSRSLSVPTHHPLMGVYS